MPRQKLSKAEALLTGAAAKNPQRYEDKPNELPVRGPIGKAPRHMTDEEQSIWREIVSQAPLGLLGSCDRLAVETACKMVLKMRKSSLSMKASEYSSLINVLGKLGLTPGDRARLNVTTPPVNMPVEDDPWAGL